MTGLPLSSVYWLIAKGEIPARKVGSTVLVPGHWLDATPQDAAVRETR